MVMTVVQVIATYGCWVESDSGRETIKKAKAEKLLSEVTSYYRERSDSLGVESARFLIGNIAGHGTYNAKLKGVIPDEEEVTPRYLIGTINSSLTRCRQMIEGGELRKRDFLEFVLPHRIGKERLTEWKAQCLNRYRGLDDSLGRGKDAHSAALARIVGLNTPLIGYFTDRHDMPNARNLNWEELVKQNSGDCIAMAHTVTYPLRALGIPVAHDFSTAWGNVNGNGHAWNAYVTRSGPVPFMGFEASPPAYRPLGIYESIGRLPAKVFRETYSVNKVTLPHLMPRTADIPASLNFERAIDVTSEYVATDNLRVKLGAQTAKARHGEMIYLSCFNAGQWKPVFWSEYTGNAYRFRNMATNILYLLTTFDNKKGPDPIDYPFVVEHGTVRKFRPDMTRRQDISITHTQPKVLDVLALFGPQLSQPEFFRQVAAVMKDEKRSTPEPGKKYQLYFWRGGWKLAGTETAGPDHQLVFRHIPQNAIYRLISDKNIEQTARVFSYEGKQEWW